MNIWNERNGQRATVKRPGTKEYKADFENRTKMFFEKGTQSACRRCNSTRVTAVGKNGELYIYCAICGKLLKHIITRNTKVGNWDWKKQNRSQAGLCMECGCGKYHGKMHISANGQKYHVSLICNKCGQKVEWHNV